MTMADSLSNLRFEIHFDPYSSIVFNFGGFISQKVLVTGLNLLLIDPLLNGLTNQMRVNQKPKI